MNNEVDTEITTKWLTLGGLSEVGTMYQAVTEMDVLEALDEVSSQLRI
eukprot:CAMPEP_0174282502 /NCGR_PEP_ID=MMETSP0809-20121228/3023_1 /TAXON_ID=73025 ORGANISM="Eutreptiella gymnastica-like, Strain CCMP1594" /NCGR_SAMPLE_ID=MMETSP0809 /ASSEMBLY_ACC=CAM_ASM_000658 /LENGTH=47 /DNA_ID= /DNA_START= /DNA_END= /DNA_ORIENTATION=